MRGLSATSEAARWYSRSYNRAGFCRLAEALGWAPRGARLAVARQLARVAYRMLAAERTIVRESLERITDASGPELDALTKRVFADFAMCFADLVSTNRSAASDLLAWVAAIDGAEHLEGVSGGVVAMTAHVGNWELGGRPLATHRAARSGERRGGEERK